MDGHGETSIKTYIHDEISLPRINHVGNKVTLGWDGGQENPLPLQLWYLAPLYLNK